MNTIAFITFHIVATGTDSKDVGAAIFVSFETFVGGFNESNEIENIALTAGDFGDDVVAPNN